MPRSEKVSYWRGKHASIPNALISGRILFEEDTGHAFIEYKDYTTGELVRRQVTDNRKFDIAGGFGALQTAAFTGPVILAQHPEEIEEYINNNPDLDWSIPHIAATKQYVDDVDTSLQQHSENSELHLGMHSDISERDYWNQKVDSVEGKGLSSNDYTDAEKTKLSEISKGANKTAITQIQTSGIAIGSITIDDVEYTIYAPPEIKDIEGNANTATQLQNPQYIDGVSFDGTKQIIHFATCGLSGDVQIKQVYLDDYQCKIGSLVYVLFYNDNKAESPQLKVSDTAAYPITYHNKAIPADKLNAGLYAFVFEGNNYALIGSVDTTYGEATDDQAGLMSSEYKQMIDAMKTKLDGIEDGASSSTYEYILPEATRSALGGVIVGDNISLSSGTISLSKENITEALGYTPANGAPIDVDAIKAQIGLFQGATKTSNGKNGLVPAPNYSSKDYTKFLKGDGQWSDISVPTFTGATATSSGTSGSVPAPSVSENPNTGEISSDYNKFLRGDGTWATVDTSGDSADISSISIMDINNICAKDETPITLQSLSAKYVSWKSTGLAEYSPSITSKYYSVNICSNLDSSADIILKTGITYRIDIPVSYKLSNYYQYAFFTPDEDFDTKSSNDDGVLYFYWEDMYFESEDSRFGKGILRFTGSGNKQFDCIVFRLFEDEYKALAGRLKITLEDKLANKYPNAIDMTTHFNISYGSSGIKAIPLDTNSELLSASKYYAFKVATDSTGSSYQYLILKLESEIEFAAQETYNYLSATWSQITNKKITCVDKNKLASTLSIYAIIK